MRHHANRGRSWESTLDDLHAHYNRTNRASILRTPAPMRVIRPASIPGQFFARYEGEGPPDFAGVVNGTALSFDAKSHTEDRWPLSKLEAHQAAHFDRHTAHGGLAFVLLRMERETYLLPWSTLAPLWHAWAKGEARRGDASLTHERCGEIGVVLDGPDWLVAARGLVAP